MPNSVLTLRGRITWAHDYNPNRSIAATLQPLPGASLRRRRGAGQRPALTSASMERKRTNGVSIAGTFEGEFSVVTRSYAGKGVVSRRQFDGAAGLATTRWRRSFVDIPRRRRTHHRRLFRGRATARRA
jgi:hypothetical protein